MRKPEKSRTKRLASIKRGLKRSTRLKDSRVKVAERKKQFQEAKKLHDKKMAAMVDKILQARFKQ